MKELKKQFSSLGLMFFLGTIIIYAAQLIPMLIIQAVKPEWIEDPNLNILIAVLPLYLVGMPALILLVKRVPAQAPEKHSIKKGSMAVAAIMCFAVMYLSNIAGLVVTYVVGRLKGEGVQNVVADMTAETSLWLIIGYMVICAPIMEEYVFRKLIVDRTVKYGQGVAVLMSGLMFGLFHGNLNQFVYAFTLGMFFAFLYVKTGNIKITIALHMMINFVGGFLSTILTRSLDMDAYMEAFGSGDMNLIMEYTANNAGPLAAFGCFAIFVFGMMIAGAVLLIIAFAKKKFKVEKGEVELPKGKRFSTIFLNVGMILYCIFWLAMIVWQLFA